MINPFFLITLSFPGLIVQVILRGFQSRSNIFLISFWCFFFFGVPYRQKMQEVVQLDIMMNLGLWLMAVSSSSGIMVYFFVL